MLLAASATCNADACIAWHATAASSPACLAVASLAVVALVLGVVAGSFVVAALVVGADVSSPLFTGSSSGVFFFFLPSFVVVFLVLFLYMIC